MNYIYLVLKSYVAYRILRVKCMVITILVYLDKWWKCLYGRSGGTKVEAITLNKCRFPHNNKFKMSILTWSLGDNDASSQRPSLLQSTHLKSTCRDRGHWVTYTGLKSTEECKLFGVILLNFSYLFICILACPAKILPFLGCPKYVCCGKLLL